MKALNIKRWIMYRSIRVAGLIIIFLFLFSGGAKGEVLPGKLIKVAGDNNYPPYEFISDSGVYKGFNNDIIQAISINEELDIELYPMAWQEAMEALEKDEVDVIQGMTISEDRAKLFDFTQSYITKEQVIFVLEGNDYVSSLEDLYGKKISYQANDINTDFIRDIHNIEKLPKENQIIAMEALLNGEADAFIGDRHTGSFYLQKEGIYGRIKIAGEPLKTTYYAIAVKKGNEELLKVLDEGVSNLKTSGTYTKIYNKWFGEVIYEEGHYLKQFLLAAWGAFFVAVMITFFTVLINKRLKDEVAKRTMGLSAANEELNSAKSQLEHNYRLLNNILGSTVSGIIALDKNLEIININSRAEALLKKKALLGTSFKGLELYQYLGNEGISSAFEGNVSTESIKINLEGKDEYIDCAISPVTEEKGIATVICMLTDRTEEIRLKNMLNIQDKMSAVGKLTTSIAHELRNPLTAIKAYIDLLPLKIDNPDFRKRMSEIVPKEIERMNILIASLLDYSKPRPPLPQKIQLKGLFSDIIGLFNPIIRRQGIKLIWDMENIYIWSDRNQIKQVFVNIILNSIEAVSRNGIIKISAKEEGDFALIEIEDNGFGIPEEDLSKIFDVFYTSANKKNGTGMGLSVSYQFVRENGGDIFYESKLGESTKAILRLPLYKSEDLQ